MRSKELMQVVYRSIVYYGSSTSCKRSTIADKDLYIGTREEYYNKAAGKRGQVISRIDYTL